MRTFEVAVNLTTSGTVIVRADDEAEAQQLVEEYFWGSCVNFGDSGCNQILDWNIDTGCDVEVTDEVVEIEDDEDEEEDEEEYDG